MPSALAIGDFSRATHLNIKALRHYHRIGLLEPAEVDPFTGHRRYTTDEIPAAQVIRRFRSLSNTAGRRRRRQQRLQVSSTSETGSTEAEPKPAISAVITGLSWGWRCR
jgi:hypothetical protein